MDKYELVLDIIERPQNYNADKLKEIFSDFETRQIYNLLCKVNSSMKKGKKIDIEAEWKIFQSKKLTRPRHLFRWFSSRVASIVIIIIFSIIAVVAGIVVTTTVFYSKNEPVTEELLNKEDFRIDIPNDTLISTKNNKEINPNLIIFEDAPLEIIMKEVANKYNVNILFKDETTAQLHLYYKLDPTLSINELAEQLNTFEQINIRFHNNTLTIE